MNVVNIKKTLKMEKIDPEDSEINNIIKEDFEKPENYLNINSKLIVGRAIRGPRFDKDKKIISHSVIGDPQIFKLPKKFEKHITFKHFINKTILNLNTTSKKKESKIPYSYIEEEKINELYNKINQDIQKKKNEKVKLNDFLNNVPINIKKELNKQEICLNSQDKFFDYNKKISKYLAKKSNKNEDELLINLQGQHRIKKEYEDLIYNKTITSFENKIPDTNWMMNLRQYKNNNIPSTSYIFYGDIYNPMWIPVREKTNKSVEIIRNPNMKTITNFKNLTKSNADFDSNFYNTTNISNNLNSFNTLNTFTFLNSNNESKNINTNENMNEYNNNLMAKDIIIKGISLLENEKTIAKQLTGKKIIYKKEFLDNLIYGKSSTHDSVKNNKSVSKLSGPLNFLANYSSPYKKKEAN